MSMNLHVEAERPATVTVKGVTKTITDRTTFSLWQTPTVFTRQVTALKSTEEMVEAYCAWARAGSKPEEEDVYADDDYFSEGPVIGKRTVDWGLDHINEFRAWVAMCAEEDYTITFYEM